LDSDNEDDDDFVRPLSDIRLGDTDMHDITQLIGFMHYQK